MLTCTIHLVTAHNRAFNGGGIKGDAVTLGSKCGGRNAEFHTVQPEVTVLAVRLLGTETDSNGSAAVLCGGNNYTVIIDSSASEVGSNAAAQVIDTEGKRTAFELLDDFGSTVIGIQCCFSQFHRKVCGHSFGKLLGSFVAFVALGIFGDFGIKEFIKTDSCHIGYSSIS